MPAGELKAYAGTYGVRQVRVEGALLILPFDFAQGTPSFVEGCSGKAARR